MISTAKAESSIGNVPGAFNGLMLSHKCLRHFSVPLHLKSLSEPVNSSAFEVIEISLSKVALVSKESMHSSVEVTTEYHSVGFSQTKGYFNVLGSLIESMEGVKSCDVGVVTDKLGLKDVRSEYISEESVANGSGQLVCLGVGPCVMIPDERHPGHLECAQHLVSLFVLSALAGAGDIARDDYQVDLTGQVRVDQVDCAARRLHTVAVLLVVVGRGTALADVDVTQDAQPEGAHRYCKQTAQGR